MNRRWMRGLLCLALAGAIWGCGGDEEDPAGDDWEPPLAAVATEVIWTPSMGDAAAYDSVTGTVHERGCLDPGGDSSWMLDASKFEQETTFTLIEDKMSLHDQLDISYSASLNAGCYKQNSQYRMVNDFQLDTHSIWAMLRVSVKGPTLRRSNLTMASPYYGASRPPDLASFRHACGDQFLYRIHTGAEYYALLRISISNLQEKNDLKVKLKNETNVAGLKFGSTVDFENHFGLTRGSTQIRSYVYKSGALTAQVVDDVGSLMTDAETWLSRVVNDFQCTRTGAGDVWGSSYACGDWNALVQLKNQYAMKGSFLSYSDAADWGRAPATARPRLPTGLAWMGTLGQEFARNLVARDALNSVVSAPDLYLAATAPLTVFGRADLTGRYPLLQAPETLPYAVADSQQLRDLQTMAAKVTASLDGLRTIARICTEDSTQGPLPATIEATCTEACADPALAQKFGGTGGDCLSRCRTTEMCDVAYALYAPEPELHVIEIKGNLLGRPEGLPGSLKWRAPGETAWQTFTLPGQRQRTPLGCGDYLAEAAGATLPDGEYLVYYAGNPDRPLYVYCQGMNTTSPVAYLTFPRTTPAALHGQRPAVNSSAADDQMANFCGKGDVSHLNGRYYEKMRIHQAEGVLFLQPDLTFSTTNGNWSGFIYAEDVSHQSGHFDVDLRGLPLEIAHRQQFLTGDAPFTTDFEWGFLRIRLDSDPEPKADNRVLQKLRASINAGARRVAYPIDYTDAEESATTNDGLHRLQATHPQGYLRLSYIDAEAQQAVAEHRMEFRKQRVETPAGKTGDTIVSFRKLAF